ncbi:hypothetical protein [Bacillus sp. CGMCC 1.16541]|uniref:hypothetical protein n=1 Tax=Bacillus sp. CGMCC 1.16541 TaxID=2185143 RepID=UPI0013A564D7|nr:hypothetical protein [Bacillus sp. CGMCC 1.16541]
MGYVLPVHNHQYTQYANRTIGTKHSYHQVEKVSKVGIDSRLKQPLHSSPLFQHREKSKRKVLPVRNVYGKTRVEGMLAELTGKGQLINESV